MKPINKTITSSILGIILLSGLGCSSKYPVTFDSTPQGASLVCDGRNFGYTPMTLYFDTNLKEQAFLRLTECSANWISGAKSNYQNIFLSQFPDGVLQTLERPDIEGYEKDAQFSMQVQMMNYQKRQTESAESSASSAAYQNIQNATRNYQLQQQNNQLQNINNTIKYGY